MAEKKLLFSVTASDCKWSYTRGSGKGGQKKNKTSNAVHCIHEPSGAHGYSEETRSQPTNRQLAFVRMVKSPEFQKWHRLEVSRRTGEAAVVDAIVERELKNVKVEARKDDKWVEVDKETLNEE